MTRKELKELKLQKEQMFIESIKHKKIDGKTKAKFRTTSVWKNFRKKFANGKDPVTLKKLPKRFQLHHCSLNSEMYTDLNPNNFRAIGSSTMHDIIHYLYGYYRKDRNVIKRLQKILDLMCELNDNKDIKDFK